MKRITPSLFIFGLLFCASIYADDALTGKTVRNFIESLKDLEQLGKKYDDDKVFNAGGNGSIDQTMQQMQSPFSTMTKAMSGSKAYSEFLNVMKRHGFNTPEEWSQVGNRIYRAMAAIQMEKEMPGDINQQIAQAKEQMKSSGMSAEQQKAMMDMMVASQQVMQQFRNVPQADRDTVKPYIGEFERLGNE